jgi:hypothetical protein
MVEGTTWIKREKVENQELNLKLHIFTSLKVFNTLNQEILISTLCFLPLRYDLSHCPALLSIP